MADEAGGGSAVLRTLLMMTVLFGGIGVYLYVKLHDRGAAAPAPTPAADAVVTPSLDPHSSTWVPPSAPVQLVRHPAARGGVPLELQFSGVDVVIRGALRRGLDPLSAALSSCVGGPADLVLSPDGDGVVRAVLRFPVRANLCPAVIRGGLVDVGGLVAVASALRTWRETVAAAHPALAKLTLGVRVEDTTGDVTLWVDGAAFASCVGVDGEDQCFDGGERRSFPFPAGHDLSRVQAVLAP